MASLLGNKTASVQAMAALGTGLTDAQKNQFDKISKKPFRDQAVWFLNGFWIDGPNFSENPDKRELMWEYVHRMTELHPSGENGCELDEFKGHVFLEKSGMTLTVAKMRAVMKEIDLDFNKYISLTEFLVFHFKVKITDLVDAPQAADPAAAMRISAARNAVNLAQSKCAASQQAEAESKKASEAAHKAELAAAAALAELEAEQKKNRRFDCQPHGQGCRHVSGGCQARAGQLEARSGEGQRPAAAEPREDHPGCGIAQAQEG
jgi:hypothetical protein